MQHCCFWRNKLLVLFLEGTQTTFPAQSKSATAIKWLQRSLTY